MKNHHFHIFYVIRVKFHYDVNLLHDIHYRHPTALIIMWIQSIIFMENDVWTKLVNCLCIHERVIFFYYFSSEATKYRNTFEWVHKQFITTCIILFLTWYDEPINSDKKQILTHRLHVSTHSVWVMMMTSWSVTQSITWCHNCDISMWKVTH